MSFPSPATLQNNDLIRQVLEATNINADLLLSVVELLSSGKLTFTTNGGDVQEVDLSTVFLKRSEAGELASGNNPANEDESGIAKLATTQLAVEGEDDTTAMTPQKTRIAFDQWVAQVTLGEGTLVDPVPDSDGIASFVGFDGAYKTLTAAQAAALLLTVARLLALFSSLSETETTSGYVPIFSEGNLKRINVLKLIGKGSTSTVTGNGFKDLPVGNYAATEFGNPYAPRYYQFITLPASNSATYDFAVVHAVFGAWEKGGQLSITELTGTFRNRSGFRPNYTLNGPNTDASIVFRRDTSGRAVGYVHYTGGYCFAAISVHTNQGTIHSDFPAVLGQNAAGQPSNNFPPPGDEAFDSQKTAVYKPVSWFDGERWIIKHPTNLQSLMVDDEVIITGLRNIAKGTRFSQLVSPLEGPEKGKIFRVTDADLREYYTEELKMVDRPDALASLLVAGSINKLSGIVGVALSVNLPQALFKGGVTPYAFTVSGQPPNMTYNSGTGNLSGAPTANGIFTVVVAASDSTTPTALTGRLTFVIEIAPASNRAPVPPAQTVIQHRSGILETIQLEPFMDPEGQPLSYNIVPSIGEITPNNATGQIQVSAALTASDNPAANIYGISYSATDSAGATTVHHIDLIVIANPLSLIAPVINATTKTITFRTAGGNGSQIEFMCPGITGWTPNPTHPLGGLYNDPKTILIKARQNGYEAELSFDLAGAINQPNLPKPTPPAFPAQNYTVGTPVNYAIPTGWTAPNGTTITGFTFSGDADSMPGLEVGSPPVGSGQVSVGFAIYGTPTQAGNYTIVVTAYASNGAQGEGTITVVVTGGTDDASPDDESQGSFN